MLLLNHLVSFTLCFEAWVLCDNIQIKPREIFNIFSLINNKIQNRTKHGYCSPTHQEYNPVSSTETPASKIFKWCIRNCQIASLWYFCLCIFTFHFCSIYKRDGQEKEQGEETAPLSISHLREINITRNTHTHTYTLSILGCESHKCRSRVQRSNHKLLVLENTVTQGSLQVTEGPIK